MVGIKIELKAIEYNNKDTLSFEKWKGRARVYSFNSGLTFPGGYFELTSYDKETGKEEYEAGMTFQDYVRKIGTEPEWLKRKQEDAKHRL